MKTKLLLCSICCLSLGIVGARAQTIWIWNSNTDGALLETNANWSPSTSNPTSSSTRTYQIGGPGSGTGNPNWNSGEIHQNATVNQLGLTVLAPRNVTTAAISGTWNLNGGSLIYQEDSTLNRRLHVKANATLNVNGGTLGTQVGTNGLRGTINAEGTNANINLISGAFLAGTDLSLDSDGTLNLQGGNFTLQSILMQAGITGTSYFNITGGSLSLTGTLTHGGPVAGRNGVITFGSGSGSLNIASYIKNSANSSTIDFLTGTGGALTITGYTATNYQTLWDNNTLLWNGQSKTALSGLAFSLTDFLVTGSTLTLIPEPQSVLLVVLGIGALGWARRQRRGNS